MDSGRVGGEGMSRPKHLDCVNTPGGIRRINELQELYDKDPEAYERREREQEERAQELEEQERQDYERQERAREEEREQNESGR